MVNRIHGVAIPWWAVHGLTLIGFGCLVLIPVGLGFWFASSGLHSVGRGDWSQIPEAALLYLPVCWVSAVAGITRWVWRHLLHGPPAVLRSDRTRSLDLVPQTTPMVEEYRHHFLVHLPGNEILQLDVAERALDVPWLSPVLEGLVIVHLSDFHFTGRVGKTYFKDVIGHSNLLQPDLVAITGDLVDRPDCIDWIPDTLGQLRSRFGTYFVLGNHDRKAGASRLRRMLVDSGLVDLGGRWVEVLIRDQPVVLAGNELPWFPPAADLQNAPPPSTQGGPIRILLTHSPDQLDWARAQQIDLMLAGHTHGGQVRFPLIGPILAPSLEGVRYASGTFHSPPTIMHVTRGISGQLPVRMNCPPEMAKLTLHAVAKS